MPPNSTPWMSVAGSRKWRNESTSGKPGSAVVRPRAEEFTAAIISGKNTPGNHTRLADCPRAIAGHRAVGARPGPGRVGCSSPDVRRGRTGARPLGVEAIRAPPSAPFEAAAGGVGEHVVEARLVRARVLAPDPARRGPAPRGHLGRPTASPMATSPAWTGRARRTAEPLAGLPPRRRATSIRQRGGADLAFSSSASPSRTITPWSMMAMRSASWSASSRYCVVRSTVVPSRR